MPLSFPDSDSINSVGYIDRAFVDGETLQVDGWVATSGPGPIDRLSFAIDGEPRGDAEIEYGLASEDVAEVHPRLTGAKNSRFAIRLRSGTVACGGDRLIVVKPQVGARTARSLYHVLAPSVPSPPQGHLDLVGGGINVGYEFLAHLIGLAGLQPDESVLDVGCGTGRIAYALRAYLDSSARYEGFDIVRELVEWATREITSRSSGFRFSHADVENRFYNPEGPIAPADYRFPYGDAEFDLVFLTSVFTHMRQPEIERYLDEIQRVLRPGGRCLATCFLLDDESRPLQDAGMGTFRLSHPVGGGWSSSRETPEAAIGFDADEFLGWASQRGLRLRDGYPGWWSGRFPYLTYQDVLVFDRV